MDVIQTTDGPFGIQLVDARLLHAKLEVGRDFSTWIAGRIEEYGFEEGLDYLKLDSPDLGNQVTRHGGDRRITSVENLRSPNPGGTNFCSPDWGSKGRGGHNRIDYHLSLDMAKELAMIENNEVGRKVRRYFIQMERQARELLETRAKRTLSVEQVKAKLKDTPSLRTMISMRDQAIDLAKKLDKAEGENERRVIYSMLCYVLDTIGQPAPELAIKVEQAKHLDV